MRRRRCHSDDQTGSRHDAVVRPKHPSPEPVELPAQATDVWLGACTAGCSELSLMVTDPPSQPFRCQARADGDRRLARPACADLALESCCPRRRRARGWWPDKLISQLASTRPPAQSIFSPPMFQGTHMRVVIALGGNALLKRGEPMTAEKQRGNIRSAAPALAAVASKHELVLSHGNGPQVGLLALQAAAYAEVEPYPLDVLGAQSEGMIGYVLEQELGNKAYPLRRPWPPSSPWSEVDPADPAFGNPTKFVGPVYDREQADQLAADKGWSFREDGTSWRLWFPRHSRGASSRFGLLLAAGPGSHCDLHWGGGVPTMFSSADPRRPTGVEAVIDKDLASHSRPRGRGRPVGDGIRRRRRLRGLGYARQRLLNMVTPAELRALPFAQVRWGQRSRRPPCSWREPASGPPSVPSPTPRRSSRVSVERHRK